MLADSICCDDMCAVVVNPAEGHMGPSSHAACVFRFFHDAACPPIIDNHGGATWLVGTGYWFMVSARDETWVG